MKGPSLARESNAPGDRDRHVAGARLSPDGASLVYPATRRVECSLSESFADARDGITAGVPLDTPRALSVIPTVARYRVCVIIGTRAEAVKLAPVIRELERHRRSVETIVVVTAPHREMLSQALEAFDLMPHVDLGLAGPRGGLAEFTARALMAMTQTFQERRPDVVLVQGDNATVLAAALAAHYLGIPVAHVEAGVRSGYLRNPFPEELTRRLAAVVGDLHFAPTAHARENLLREGVQPRQIVVCGNTVVDALRLTPRRTLFREPNLNVVPWTKRRVAAVTVHRRENHGDPLVHICTALAELVSMHSDLHVVVPLHLDPRVRDVMHEELGGMPRVTLLDPLEYGDMVELLRRATFAITDSGTVLEECTALGRPVLVVRRHTDRPEAVEAGLAQVVGTETLRIVDVASQLLDDPRSAQRVRDAVSPWGDGFAATRIVQVLLRRMPRQAGGMSVAEGPALLPPRHAVER